MPAIAEEGVPVGIARTYEAACVGVAACGGAAGDALQVVGLEAAECGRKRPPLSVECILRAEAMLLMQYMHCLQRGDVVVSLGL